MARSTCRWFLNRALLVWVVGRFCSRSGSREGTVVGEGDTVRERDIVGEGAVIGKGEGLKLRIKQCLLDGVFLCNAATLSDEGDDLYTHG